MILAALAVFSGLSLNLIFQLALGIRGISEASKQKRIPLFQCGSLFVSVLFLWLICQYILRSLSGGFLEYFLFFPLASLVCMGIEALWNRIYPQIEKVRVFSSLTAYDGLALASLMLTFNLAMNFTEAALLSFSFSLGCLLAMFILGEIRRRSLMEWVPHSLRGSPLAIISMGLLSMISASGAWICFRILESF
jgi:electron transport complex protein RnfA